MADNGVIPAPWFLGRQRANFEYLQELFKIALDVQYEGRKEYYPEDDDTKDSSDIPSNLAPLRGIIHVVSTLLRKYTVPSWNSRYNRISPVDTTLPGIAGHMAAMIFNPSNVTAELSPITATFERDVGEQLCEMVGIDPNKGWGHITSGGSTIANLESLWAARNLKLYPLSLTLAMENDGPLSFIEDTFMLRMHDGTEKLFADFSSWELLNIAPDIVADIPRLLYEQYHITPTFLQQAMHKYIIQSTPKDDPTLVHRFEQDGIQIGNIALVTSATKDHSWSKAAAITSIGSANIIDVGVNFDAQMDIDKLREALNKCLEDKRAIYAVVAVIGSNDHGACDPLKSIVELRDEFQNKGLSFSLHADAAWGGYYHTILNFPGGSSGTSSTILKKNTAESLLNLRHCDTITIDPHKSGYVQYAGGGLLYRDWRMRYLVTWLSPPASKPQVESVGMYGVEGRKPGATQAAVWVSNMVIGLHRDGYGALLRGAIWSAYQMYLRLTEVSSEHFRITTLNARPEVTTQLEQHTPTTENGNAIGLQISEGPSLTMGSDFSTNAFAVNFYIDEKPNEDIVEANDLNKRIFKRLSGVPIGDDINKFPLFLSSAQLAQSAYTTCLTNFKERLGLVGDQDLYTLINSVSMPFPEDKLADEIVADLRQVISEEVSISQYRNTLTPTYHGFIMQGTKSIYLVHLPMFNMADHRYQLIIMVDLPTEVLEQYVAARKKYPGRFFTLANVTPSTLLDMVKYGKFEAVIDIGLPPDDGSHFISPFSVTNVRVVKQMKLDSKYLTTYPKKTMPFYIYGTPGDEMHIDHVLLASPNIQLNSDCIKLRLNLDLPASVQDPPVPFVLHIHLPEAAMQPFPSNKDIAAAGSKFFFRPGAQFHVTITTDIELNPGEVIATGTLQLSRTMFIDTDMLNMDPVLDHDTSQVRDPTEEIGSLQSVNKEAKRDYALLHPTAIANKNVTGILVPSGSFRYYSSQKKKQNPYIPLLLHNPLTQAVDEVNLSSIVRDSTDKEKQGS